MIFIGEKVFNGDAAIYADGILNRTGSGETNGFVLDPYQLRIEYYDYEKDQYCDQLLVFWKCWSGIFRRHGYESKVVINFIGDLDGDAKDDILITLQSTYKGWSYCLFSTRYAEEGQLFKEMIVGGGSE